MALVISDSPQQVDYSRNGLNYRVFSSSRVITPTCKARFAFRKTSGLQTGSVFHIPIPDTDDFIVITAESPIITANGIASGALIATTAAQFRKIPLIEQYYTVSEVVDLIYFEFKQPGGLNDTNIKFIGTGYQDVDDDHLLLILNCDSKTVEPDYYMTAVVYYQSVFVAKLKSEADSASYCNFSPGLLLPRLLFSLGEKITSYNSASGDLSFEIKFSDHYQGQDWPLMTHSLDLVLPGKIDFQGYPNYVPVSVFLTKSKVISSNAVAFHKFAFLFLSEGSSTFEFQLKFYNRNGTVSIETVHSETSLINAIFFANLNLKDILITKPSTYRIDLLNSINEDKISIYINETAYNFKEFAFVNSFGFWETITFNAFKSAELITNRSISEKYLPVNYDAKNGQFSSKVQDAHIEYSCNSGALSQIENVAVKDFLLSNSVYEIIQDKFIKIEILSNSADLSNEESGVNIVEFKYMKSNNE